MSVADYLIGLQAAFDTVALKAGARAPALVARVLAGGRAGSGAPRVG